MNRGHFNADGEWVPEGYEYNSDGDLRFVGIDLARSSHTHADVDITVHMDGKTLPLAASIETLVRNMDNLIQFLQYKGVIVNEREYLDFVSARDLAKRMAKKNE